MNLLPGGVSFSSVKAFKRPIQNTDFTIFKRVSRYLVIYVACCCL